MAVPSAAPGVTSADALEYLQRLVHKRVELCDYIVRVHDGEAFWMNTTRICPADWVAFLGEAELFTRAKVYLDLALNFGRLLTLPTGASVVRALTQLLLEYDYSVAQDGGILELKLLASRSKSGYYPDTLSGTGDADPVKPVLHKRHGRIVFEHLVTGLPSYPGQIDYFMASACLFDVLKLLYKRLQDDSCARGLYVDAISKLDRKIKTLVFKPCMQTLSDIATTMLRAHLSSVSVLYASARGDDMSVRLSVSTATGAAGLAVASAVAESC